ncbi:MAG: hypothetical protein AABX38_01695 [Candidatus Micrarchaeota archaeon]
MSKLLSFQRITKPVVTTLLAASLVFGCKKSDPPSSIHEFSLASCPMPVLKYPRTGSWMDRQR